MNSFKDNDDYISQARVIIDGSCEHEFKRSISKYLKTKLNSKGRCVIKKLTYSDSKKDSSIQLADMIAGSIRRYYDSNTEDSELYWSLIRRKIDKLGRFN